MGAFIVNVNVRSNDRSAVERAVADMNPAAAWITGPKNGWVTVYEERASTQDGDWIKDLAEGLSKAVKSPSIAFLVHDSDFVCYWLCDGGELIDHFNSCPDYFGEDESDDESDPPDGRAELLLRYCPDGTPLSKVERVLGKHDVVFAEQHLEELAELLGIDATRARTDFGGIGTEVKPSDLDAVSVGGLASAPESDLPPLPTSTPRDTPLPGSLPAAAAGPMLSKIMETLGVAPQASDPQSERLVQAAAQNDVAEIDRLAAAGVDVNKAAVLKVPPGSESPAAGLLGRGVGTFPITPTMAAIFNKRIDATRRLIELGADLRTCHLIFGTPVHLAAVSGEPSLLQAVLDGGGDVNARNRQQQTPLEALRNLREMTKRVANLGFLREKMAGGLRAHLQQVVPPAEALDSCERLLLEREARQ
jgi:hypothetical protein